jgi:16S rRNA (guanine527-N7)-methyltransferase
VRSAQELLAQGLRTYGLDESRSELLLRFAEALLEKNKVMNLTAITDPTDVAQLHLLDCAAVLTFADIKGKSLVDVGTGAGFPGMPLQIMEPTAKCTLLDSLGKRINFLQEVCDELGLSHTRCVHARAEEYARDHREQFDFATSRAVAALNVLCELALPMVKVGGAFLAMKSVDSDEELRQAKSAIAQLGGSVESVQDYTIPGTDVTHRLVTIRKVKPTPHAFPRAFARIKKNPLI